MAKTSLRIPKRKSTQETGQDSIGSSKLLEDLNGFKVLPLIIESNLIHYMYFKQHNDRRKIESNSEKHEGDVDVPDRTLFLMNLPLGASETNLKELFEREGCGIVSKVTFKKTHVPSESNNAENETIDLEEMNETVDQDSVKSKFGPGVSAYIVFGEKQSVQRALKLRKKRRLWKGLELFASEKSLSGLSRYCKQYHMERPSPQILQMNVDTFMEKFDEDQKKKHEENEASALLPDEDGFVRVIRSRKRHANRQGDLTVIGASRSVTKNLTPQDKTISNFYRFQVRQAKEQQLQELKRKFEEDKRRIASLKASRHFRPF